MTERIINAERVEQLIDVFGSFDANIKQIEAEFGVKVTNRDTELKIQGDVEQVDYAARAIEALLSLSAKGEEIDAQKVRYLISLVKTGNEDKVGEIAKDVVCVTGEGPPGQGQDARSAEISQGHREEYHHHRRRPGRYRQNLSRCGAGRRGLPCQRGQPHHPDAARGRGRGAAGLPAGGFAE